MIQTLNKHTQIIHKENEKLSAAINIKHHIKTTTDKAIYTKSYRYPHAHKKIFKTQIQEMLTNGVIKHSDSPWNALIWVVPKKSDATGAERFRMVINYRKLNDVTIDDKYPIPQIDDIFDNLRRSEYFSTLDLKSGFHQIELEPLSLE